MNPDVAHPAPRLVARLLGICLVAAVLGLLLTLLGSSGPSALAAPAPVASTAPPSVDPCLPGACPSPPSVQVTPTAPANGPQSQPTPLPSPSASPTSQSNVLPPVPSPAAPTSPTPVTVVTAAPVAAAAPDNKSPLFFRLTQALNLSLPNADFRHGRGTLLADTVLAATALVVAAGLGYWLVAGSLPRRAIHGLSELPGRIRRRPR